MKDNLEDPKGPRDCPPWGLPPLSQRSCGLEVGWCGIQWLKQGGDLASRVFLQLSASQALTNVAGDGESNGHLCWDLEFPVLGDSNMSPQSSVTKMISFSLRVFGPPIISSFNQTQLARIFTW